MYDFSYTKKRIELAPLPKQIPVPGWDLEVPYPAKSSVKKKCCEEKKWKTP